MVLRLEFIILKICSHKSGINPEPEQLRIENDNCIKLRSHTPCSKQYIDADYKGLMTLNARTHETQQHDEKNTRKNERGPQSPQTFF